LGIPIKSGLQSRQGEMSDQGKERIYFKVSKSELEAINKAYKNSSCKSRSEFIAKTIELYFKNK
jgi:metal-responsive CopG/Arc/MetJ family transcriptional regulator